MDGAKAVGDGLSGDSAGRERQIQRQRRTPTSLGLRLSRHPGEQRGSAGRGGALSAIFRLGNGRGECGRNRLGVLAVCVAAQHPDVVKFVYAAAAAAFTAWRDPG